MTLTYMQCFLGGDVQLSCHRLDTKCDEAAIVTENRKLTRFSVTSKCTKLVILQVLNDIKKPQIDSKKIVLADFS